MYIAPEIINQATADILEGARSESRLSQKDFAAKACMSVTTVQKLLSGKQSIKTPQFLALATAAGADPGELMTKVAARSEAMSQASNILQFPKPGDTGAMENFKGARAAHPYEENATEPDDD